MSRIPQSNSSWEQQTVIGSATRAGGGSGPRMGIARTQGALNAALRSGNVVAVEKKYATGNQKGDPNGQHLTKVDRDDNVAPPAKVSMDVGRAIQKGRQEKNLTQKDLGTAINEKPNIIADYESGRAVPNQQILGKIERKLGVKLRGKDIGQPLGGPKKK